MNPPDNGQLEPDQSVYHQPAPGLDYTMQNRRETQPYNPHGEFVVTRFVGKDFIYRNFRIDVTYRSATTADHPASGAKQHSTATKQCTELCSIQLRSYAVANPVSSTF